MNTSKFIKVARTIAAVALASAAINEIVLEVKRRSKEKVVVTEVQ